MSALWPNRPAPIGDEKNLWTEYTGLVMLNYAVTVRLGRLGGELWDDDPWGTGTGTGSSDQGLCVWHIVAIYDPNGTPTTVYDEYIFINDEYDLGYTGTGTGTGTFTASCIEVPQVIVADNVAGFQLGGAEPCYGKLILGDYEKDKLPFIEIPEVTEFRESHDFGQGPIDDSVDPRFIYLCGECPDDGTASLTCVAVDGDLFSYAADINGEPSYELNDWRLWWNGSRWELDEVATVGTGTGELLTPMAYGPDDVSCPIGVWERTENWTGSIGPGTGAPLSGTQATYFCVSSCDEPWRKACGPCNRVCTRICVRGPRHSSVDTLPQTFRTFEWFEDWDANHTEVSRGWSYTNPYDSTTGTAWTDVIYLEPDADYDVIVDGVEWSRSYDPHSFGDPSYPYWYYEIGGQDAYLYWDGHNWEIMLGGNPVAYGPSVDSPDGTYLPESGYGVTYVVVVDAPTLSQMCRLRPRFETLTANELYPPTQIGERGCDSNLLVEIRETDDTYPYLRTLSVRCGWCTCWQHVCGMCRCVPRYMCVVVYYRRAAAADPGAGVGEPDLLLTNLVLEWNDEILGWGDDDDPLRLLLIADYKGDCAIDIDIDLLVGTGTDTEPYVVPTLDGHLYPNYPSFACGVEGWFREMDDDVQFPAIIYNDVEDGKTLIINALSHASACEPTPCIHATPCYDNCGGNPSAVYVDITLTFLDIDGPAYPPPAPVVVNFGTILLSYIDTGGYVTFGLAEFTCGYFGVIPAVSKDGVGVCCAIAVYLFGGVFRLRVIEPSTGGCVDSVTVGIDVPLDETCNPYSATEVSDDPRGYPDDNLIQCACRYLGTSGIRSCVGLIHVEVYE